MREFETYNFNDEITVVLNRLGIEYLINNNVNLIDIYSEFTKLNKSTPFFNKQIKNLKNENELLDKHETYQTTMQLWDLMNTFGILLGMGKPTPFVNNSFQIKRI